MVGSSKVKCPSISKCYYWTLQGHKGSVVEDVTITSKVNKKLYTKFLNKQWVVGIEQNMSIDVNSIIWDFSSRVGWIGEDIPAKSFTNSLMYPTTLIIEEKKSSSLFWSVMNNWFCDNSFILSLSLVYIFIFEIILSVRFIVAIALLIFFRLIYFFSFHSRQIKTPITQISDSIIATILSYVHIKTLTLSLSFHEIH